MNSCVSCFPGARAFEFGAASAQPVLPDELTASVSRGNAPLLQLPGFAGTPSQRPVALSAVDLERLLRDRVPLQFIDVRPPELFGQGHIEGSISRLLHELAENPQATVADRWVVLIDRNGAIALQLAEHLKSNGRPWVAYLQGGYDAWSKRSSWL